DPRLLGASPVRASTREGFVRTGFPEHTAVGLRIDAVLMGVGCTADLTRDGPVGRQLGQAPPKVRIDVPVQDLRTRIDVRVGIVRSQTGPHTLLLSSPSYGALEPHVLVGREDRHGNQVDRVIDHLWPDADQYARAPDRREHDAVDGELLDAMEHDFALR